MNGFENNQNAAGRKLTGRAALVFLAVMLLLTFFSSTLNNFTLPKVSFEAPSSGALIKEVTGTGSVQAVTVRDLYVDTPMKVTGVRVKVGDKVKQGQELMTLDTTGLENQLKDERDKYAQKKLYLEKLTQAGSADSMLSLDKAVQAAARNADKARKTYEDGERLYEAGAISADELADEKRNLDSAGAELEIAIKNKEKAISDNNRDIESARLDLNMAERKIASLMDEIGLGTVTAPCDGTVTALYYSEGMTATPSQPLYKISDIKDGFLFTASVDISAAQYLEPGDEAEVSINSFNGRIIRGKVSQVKDNGRQIGVKKDVEISIPSEGLIGGETGTADIKKNIGSFKALVPNSAIGQDSGGYFVYVLKERKGPLGNELYVQKTEVGIGDSDNLKTAVLNGLSAVDKVVSESDKALSDGSRVMLADGGD